MTWRATDPQGDECGKVKYDIVRYTRGIGLDLGCGPHKAFPHFIGIDSCKDTELFGISMKPDVVVKDCIDLSDSVADESCDFVFSSHLLEHIADYQAALASWWKTLKVGGFLVLYLPDEDEYPRVGEPGANIDHKWNVNHGRVLAAMKQVGSFDLVEFEKRNADREYSLLFVFEKREGRGVFRHSWMNKKPKKTACVVRYGGFGDQLQAANILPQLQREGYHVTFMTTPKGQDILREDPHIDSWFIQDDNQVPNHELPEFWKSQAKRFDRFINLSESVEGTLLALPGRANHAWPDSVRRKELGRNYLEWTAELAEVPYASESRFYPSDPESAWAGGYLAEWKRDETPNALAKPPEHFTILWVLSGSSQHKFYPHMDAAITRILRDIPSARIIFSGDALCELLEFGWENEKRIKCESGHLSIRETLSLAQRVDLVIGPETGVLNGVAFENNAKVVLLSHSSEENLTKHWVNATAIMPFKTPCYPCHRLHYTREFCPEDMQTGASVCAASIDPGVVAHTVLAYYEELCSMRSALDSFDSKEAA